MKPIIGTSHEDCEAQFKLAVLKKEAWIKNIMRVLNQTRQQAEEAWNKIEQTTKHEEHSKHQDQGDPSVS